LINGMPRLHIYKELLECAVTLRRVTRFGLGY
jgi:hypothetical protein